MIQIEEKTRDGRMILRIHGDMTVHHAGELKAAFLRAVDGHDSVEVDLREVTSADISGIQLLFAAYRTSHAAKKDFVIRESIPDSVLGALDRSGYRFYLRKLIKEPS